MEDFNDVIKGDKLTLVDFFATWCQPCKMMHPLLVQLKKDYGDSIRVIKMNVEENQDMAMQYAIQSVPTLILFRRGEILWRQSGLVMLNDLRQLIDHFSDSAS